MKPTMPLRLATLLSPLILTACLTPSGPAPLDVPALQAQAAEVAIDGFCRGQTPRSLDSIAWTDADGVLHQGVTVDEFRAAPGWAQIYVVSNDAQWARPCEARAR